MSVEGLHPDVYTWDDLRELGRREVATRSGNQWTLHGPVDPGITLLELFASQIEQNLFRLDHEPPDVVRGVLALLGLAAPKPATAATTVLSVELSGSTTARIARGARATPFLARDDVVLGTEHDLDAVPGLTVTGIDDSPDPQRVVAFTMTHASSIGPRRPSLFFEVEIGDQVDSGTVLERDLRGPLGWWFDTDGEPAPTVIDPEGDERPPLEPAATLRWTVDVGSYHGDVTAVSDGTFGLRHSGAVVLDLPEAAGARWSPGTALRVTASADLSSFTYVPKVARIIGNAVVARSIETAWSVLADLPDGLEWIFDGGVRAVNVIPPFGGSEPETITDARDRAMQEQRSDDRLVTRADYVEVAMQTPGVDLANAFVVEDLDVVRPCNPAPDSVTVVCVPRVPRRDDVPRVAAPHLDDGARQGIQSRFDARRLVGTFVRVVSPTYTKVEVEVSITGRPADASELRGHITGAVLDQLDLMPSGDAPGATGPHRVGWQLGDPVSPSALIAATQRAVGSRHVISGVSVTVDGRTETSRPITLGRLALPEITADDIVVRFGAAE